MRIDIETLLNGNIVESERIEFKEGWNPQSILHTICAFANDFNNIGGGYLIIGIKEKDGIPMLPPLGLTQSKVDAIQKEIVHYCNTWLSGGYIPIIEHYFYQEKHILLLYCPGGDNRPYRVAESLTKGSNRIPYIRKGALTAKVRRNEEEIQLYNLASRIPFDDRINHGASITDVSPLLILDYLSEIDSPLLKEIDRLSHLDLLRKMQLVAGAKEYVKPRNIALMLFNKTPEKFFTGIGIDIVELRDLNGKSYKENKIRGPIHIQIKEALTYFKNQIQKEEIRKISGQATARRFYNYPFEAFEEILVNAVYHMGYDQDEKVEIRVLPEKIEVISYPGPLPPIDQDMLKDEVVVARRYRNRRLGDFLKELKLTEGRATGIPTIRESLRANYSNDPIFEMDKDRNYFKATMFIHPDSEVVFSKKREIERLILNDLEQLILENCQIEPKTFLEFVKGIIRYKEKEILISINELEQKNLIKSKRIGEESIYFISKTGLKALDNSF